MYIYSACWKVLFDIKFRFISEIFRSFKKKYFNRFLNLIIICKLIIDFIPTYLSTYLPTVSKITNISLKNSNLTGVEFLRLVWKIFEIVIWKLNYNCINMYIHIYFYYPCTHLLFSSLLGVSECENLELNGWVVLHIMGGHYVMRAIREYLNPRK